MRRSIRIRNIGAICSDIRFNTPSLVASTNQTICNARRNESHIAAIRMSRKHSNVIKHYIITNQARLSRAPVGDLQLFLFLALLHTFFRNICMLFYFPIF